MYNRKKRLFLTAVCLSLGLLTGCNVGNTKNYKQAAQDLEQGNYEAALEEYETAISEGVKPAQSYRGAGVAKLKLGNYEEAITYFNDALKCDKVGKALKKDILSYRAVAYLKVKDYEAALEDCQTLAENYKMDADLYFLTGETALAMDSYEEASANFEQAYGEDATYDRAIQIYGAYLNRDMEADGTRYLEAALSGTAKNAEDHCDRGRVYYYMDDYENAESELKQAIDEILKLNPKPGGTVADFSYGQQAEKIIPDFMLDLVDGELQLSLNSGDIPELKINKAYLNILEQYQKDQSPKNKKDVVSFVKYKLNSARSFIDAVQQRDNTLMLTMTAIVQFQKQFFLTGDETMLKPMILKDIADITGLDVSTISRVSNSKYVQTWFGIYALKDFFTGSMQTTSGEEVSTGELKNMLKKLVDDEDKKKPLTDDELVILMEKAGYQIARRTVAKYRQMLDIPVARLRREI